MPSSLISSSSLTTARSELPCAVTSTVLPALRSSKIGPYRYDSIRATTSARHSVFGMRVAEVRVPGVAGLGVLVGVADRRRRGVVGAPPQHELLLAVGLQGLLLVLALQIAVVPLVEPPGPANRDPVPVGRIQGQVGRRDGPTQQRGVQHVGQHTGVGQQRAAADRLRGALLRQGHVDPAGELVQRVPGALAVTQQDQVEVMAGIVPQAREPTRWGSPGLTARAR